MENHSLHHKDKKESCHSDSPNVDSMGLQNIRESLMSYKPLIVILVFCLLIPLSQIQPFEAEKFMSYFMGYFFTFLSLFKFFDLRGFVEGFSTYDLVTKRFQVYGYAYPFIEFFLGIAYLSQFNPLLINWITVIVMFVSGIGVLNSILSHQKINCACLGAVLNVPLSTVSILENFGMAAMAAYQLIFMY